MIKFARELRIKSTDAELMLWYHLRARRFFGFKFRRQMLFEPYIVDFVCIEKKLIIEVDGGQHVERVRADNERTKFLNKKGYKVIRFWNNDVLNNLAGVFEVIYQFLMK